MYFCIQISCLTLCQHSADHGSDIVMKKFSIDM